MDFDDGPLEDRRKPKKRVYADWYYERRAEIEKEEMEKSFGATAVPVFWYATVFLTAVALGAISVWLVKLLQLTP